MSSFAKEQVGFLDTLFIEDATERHILARPVWRCVCCGFLSLDYERPTECEACPDQWAAFDYPRGNARP